MHCLSIFEIFFVHQNRWKKHKNKHKEEALQALMTINSDNLNFLCQGKVSSGQVVKSHVVQLPKNVIIFIVS